MDSVSVPQLIANASLGGSAAIVAVLTLARVGLLFNGGRTRRAVAEILEAGIIAIALLFFVIQPFLAKTFYIPSGSMLPTIVENDHVIVDKLSYRFSEPYEGAVVVFVAPRLALQNASDDSDTGANSSPVDYIKRTVGLPGDVVVVHHGFILVNGREETHADIRRVLGLMDPNSQHVRIEADDLLVTNGNVAHYNAAQVAEMFGVPNAAVIFHPGVTIHDGAALIEPYTAEDPSYDFKLVNGHAVRLDPDDDLRFDGVSPNKYQLLQAQVDPPGPVPPGDILVFGDNRNDSNDSTLWGPLNQKNLVGHAVVIFWPTNRARLLK